MSGRSGHRHISRFLGRAPPQFGKPIGSVMKRQ